MAETESPDIIIMNAIWAALVASSYFAGVIKPNNRLVETLQKAGGVNFEPDSKPSKQSADFPEVDIDIGAFNMTSQMKTFGGCVRTEEHRQFFPLTITTDELGVTDALRVKRTVLNALRAAGRTLGIPKNTLAVLDWEIPSGSSNKVKVPGMDLSDTGGQMRRQLSFNIAVRYRIQV